MVRHKLRRMSVTLETERLILRSWTIDDFEDVAARNADPEVMRFLAVDGQPMSRFASWQSLCAHVGHWALRGFGQFAIVERATNQFVGRVGPWHPEGWPEFEIGWTLGSAQWGKGYATEAARKAWNTHSLSWGEPTW
jgi:RimJ/RimL family protein N-acetyltransferase